MRVIMCDCCGNYILPPKHIFTIEGRDRDTSGNYRSPGSETIKVELCVNCHNDVKKVLKPRFKMEVEDEDTDQTE